VLSSAEKRELATRGHHLKAHVNVGGGELSDAAVEHVRKAFGDKDLLKVRVSTDDRDECTTTARQLAERVPCELVRVMGRVALLYRAGAEGDPNGE
jgi:RNA-binding protein